MFLAFNHPCSVLIKLPDFSRIPSSSTSVAAQLTTKKKQPVPPLGFRSIPLAASLCIILHSYPADAGIMSGISGIESVDVPQLPPIEFLKKLNDANQKKYAENDARFRSSPIVKELLEKSRQNKERNQRLIQDKYCIRGAEWGVGDCSADGMSQAQKEDFIAMLKKKSEESVAKQ